MAKSLKKRGQKVIQKFSRASIKVSEEGGEHIKKNLIERISNVRNVRLLIFEWGLLVGALIMLALTQAFWFGDSYAENVYTYGGTYTEATIGEVNSMNPLFATTNSEKVLSKLMFATLSTIDYSGHPGNQLAKSILASEDGKKWTVMLRDGLKWSDGEPITSDDVVFTAELIKNPAVNTVYEANLSNVKVSLDEEGNVVFNLPTAYADFMSALNFPIVPKHVLEGTDPKTLIENSFSSAPISSGMFMLNATQSTSTASDKTIYLSANPNYYKGRPMLNNFAIHTYDNKESVINAINAGTIAATAELSEADRSKITSSGFVQRDSSLNSGAFIFFNTARETVGDASLRAAIRKGLNLDKIRSLVPETAKLDFPFLASQIQITEYPEIPTYDFAEAKNSVTEITEGNPASLEIATVKSGYLPEVAKAVAEDLKALGFNANVTTYEENQEFINNIISKRSYDLLIYEIELGADPDLLPYYHSSQASGTGLNLSNYKNALVDDLLLGARDTMNKSLRAKKYETFLRYWVDDVPAIGLYQPNLTYFYNKNVRTYGNSVRLVTAIDRFSDAQNWAVNKTTENKTP